MATIMMPGMAPYTGDDPYIKQLYNRMNDLEEWLHYALSRLGSENLLEEAVQTQNLAKGSVTAEKVSKGAITADKLSANAISAKNLSVDAMNAISAHIVSADIDWAKIESLQAAVAEITSAAIQDVEIDYARIKDLAADTAIITKVHTTTPCDTYFPNLDEDPDWYLAETLQSGEENGISYEMCLYKRKGSKTTYLLCQRGNGRFW